MTYIQQHILKTHTLEAFSQLHPFDWQLIIFTAYLTRVDGKFTYFEEHKIQRTFQSFFDKSQQKLACESVQRVRTTDVIWSKLIYEFNSLTSLSDRLQVITFLFEMACTDGSLVDEELSFIHQLSKDFEIAELSFLKILDQYKMWNKTFRAKVLDKLNESIDGELQNKRLRALTILGLLPHATDTEIKKSYRNLMKKHHPDANPHLTVKEMVYHKKQMFKINEAYAFLIK